MRRYIHQMGWLRGALAALLTACGSSEAEQQHPLRQQFARQVQQSCEQGQYEKTTLDLQQAEAELEVQTHELRTNPEDSVACMLEEELDYGLLALYEDPAHEEFMQIARQGDTLIAMAAPDAKSRTELQLQKILMGPDSTLRYVESRLAQTNWLYSTDVHVRIHFDSLGRYQRHRLRIITSIAFIGKDFQAEIRGKNDYP